MNLKQYLPFTNRNARIGDVKESILTEIQFQAVHDGTWVLMDGRDITGSDLATLTGSTTLPDARGQFLRGKNNGRLDGNEDPDGERAIGHWQEDKMQGHEHRLTGSFTGVAAGGGSAWGTGGTTDTHPTLYSDGTNGTPRTGSETAPKNIAVNIFVKINE